MLKVQANGEIFLARSLHNKDKINSKVTEITYNDIPLTYVINYSVNLRDDFYFT